jgi:hypothetical protein
MRAHRPTSRRSLWHRLGAALSLCAYLFAGFGLPLPAAPVRKDTSVPYPCMNNPCGCRSAEQCWRNCCCMTVEERWAWARAHNVQPPPYAVRPSTDIAKTCCTEGGCRKGCCHSGDCRHEAAARADDSTDWVLGVAALRCRGVTAEWASIGAVLPPVEPITWAPSREAGEWLPSIDETTAPFRPAPTAPPPR